MAMGIVVVVEEEVSVTSVDKIVISQGNVVEIVNIAVVEVVGDMVA